MVRSYLKHVPKSPQTSTSSTAGVFTGHSVCIGGTASGSLPRPVLSECIASTEIDVLAQFQLACDKLQEHAFHDLAVESKSFHVQKLVAVEEHSRQHRHPVPLGEGTQFSGLDGGCLPSENLLDEFCRVAIVGLVRQSLGHPQHE